MTNVTGLTRLYLLSAGVNTAAHGRWMCTSLVIPVNRSICRLEAPILPGRSLPEISSFTHSGAWSTFFDVKEVGPC